MDVFNEKKPISGQSVPPHRAELVGGRTIKSAPSVRNFRVAQKLFDSISRQLDLKEARVFLGERVFLDEQNCFVPDIAVVCDLDKIKEDGSHGVPDFVVEILIPATEFLLRGSKRAAYEAAGVREFWIVDAHTKQVEIYKFEKHQQGQ